MKQQEAVAVVSRPCQTSTPSKHDAGGDGPSARSAESPTRSPAHLVVFSLLLLVGISLSFRSWISTPMIRGWSSGEAASHDQRTYPPLTCPPANHSAAALYCPSSPPPPGPAWELPSQPAELCPAYFRWIHEDLRPWARTGITRDMVERAKEKADFRLVVISGRAYVVKYRPTFQTRDLFTQWGILQLLRRHPGRVPDLDLMFQCGDLPVVKRADYPGDRVNTTAPPLFRYGSDDASVDVVFPDWSFWGWPEVNIKPWERLMEELKGANRRMRWVDREPHAFWRGNPWVAPWRQDLLKCNLSGGHDWHARLYVQDWGSEIKQGFKNSDLTSQCKHRYKIYIEGASWSVSDKYILACDSPTLRVEPRYHHFFSRGLEPLHHYWPVRSKAKCPDIKFAVEWGNTHQKKAREIGKGGSRFVQKELKMDYVYDYMLHLLTEYSKLLRFKPTKPPKAVELCQDLMACPAKEREKEYMVQSMVKGPRSAGPCKLPPPFTPAEMSRLTAERANSTRQVQLWEQEKARIRGRKAKKEGNDNKIHPSDGHLEISAPRASLCIDPAREDQRAEEALYIP
ncbi:hypothetical protein Taro_026559 [Colocasia esculenta]|uniref:Glycosyl transferase CAP10 domain-containing protein n=1 Tax=Colocasia esculenta TaxID=4460 RepID=A0A843VJW6_COLES|nr:hypothetical protein [Colocasia esculenta]